MALIKPLSDELKKVAIEELGEVPSRIPDDLHALKIWIQQQPHLKARTDDQFLIQFLRGSKYSLEKAKKKLDCFYALRTKFPFLGGPVDVDCPKFRNKLNMGCSAVLPTPLNGCGPRIMVVRATYPTDKYSLDEMLETINAVHERFITSDPYACVCGTVYVLDLAQCTLNHLLQATPTLAKKQVAYYIKAVPLRIKAIYVINVPKTALKVIEMIISLLPENFKQRIFLSDKNIKSLDEHIPLTYMPEEYGGSNGSLQQLIAEQHKIWDEYREYFRENLKYGTDEQLRPGSPMYFDETFGGCGSFRKLNVD